MHKTEIQRFVVMGVSGCGKSSVAKELARQIEGAFIEGDDLHDATSIEKMSRGEPLTDDDRWPWLERLGVAIAAAETPVVASCSALKKGYRDRIRQQVKRENNEAVGFLHLVAEFDVINQRMQQRANHFMPSSLLASQFEALEPLEDDEIGVDIVVAGDLSQVVAKATQAVLNNEYGLVK